MRTFIRPLAAAALVGALMTSPLAQAQTGPRIGFVNIDRLLQEAPSARAAQTKLEREFSAREKEIDAAADKLQKAADQFDVDATTMSEDKRVARQRELIEQDRSLQERQVAFSEELNTRKQEELQNVLDRANTVMRQIAERDKYDAIFQEAAYIKPGLDITDQVIKAMAQ